MKSLLWVALLTVFFGSVQSTVGQEFELGHYFASDEANGAIDEFDETGNYVGTIDLNLGSDEILRGITFGHDGLLYATIPSHTSAAKVVAYDHNGTALQNYYFTSFTGSNISYGKIAFGADDKFYVTSGNGVVEFTVGNTASADLIYSSDAFDLDVMPNGNLLVANNYNIQELDSAGNFLRTINLSDPNNNADGASVGFTNLRGIEYDPINDIIFATHLGHTGFSFRLMKLEADTGYLIDHEYFWYGDDLFLDSNDNLLVGSRTQTPGFFNQNLNYLQPLGDETYKFVTQYSFAAVPEPGSCSILCIAAAGVFLKRRRRPC